MQKTIILNVVSRLLRDGNTPGGHLRHHFSIRLRRIQTGDDDAVTRDLGGDESDPPDIYGASLA